MTIKKSKFKKGIVIKPDAVALEGIEGEIKVDSGDNKIKTTLGASSKELITNDQTQTLTNKTIDASSNTISNITDTEISASADITRTKLAPGTADHVLINDATGEVSSEAQLSKTRGGTGADNSSVTFPSTGTIVTEAGTQTLTNKTINADNNTISNLATTHLAAGVLDTDLNTVSGLDDTIPSAKATKAYVDAQIAGVPSSDELAKVSANDTTAGYLNGKLVAGANITLTENNDGGNETLTIASTASGGETNTMSNVGTGDGQVYKQKTGVNFELKNIADGINSDIVDGTSDITVNVLNVISTKTTNYTLTDTDTTILVDSSGGVITITLPTAVGRQGKIFTIKAIDAQNTISIEPDGSETIDGNATLTLDAQYDGIIIQSDNVNWHIIANAGAEPTGTPPSSNFPGDTAGFTSGGGGGGTIIDRFLFSSNVTAADHGDLSVSRTSAAGQSSSTQGFTSGGFTGADSNVIDKFDFSSNVTAADHGDLSVARRETSGSSSDTQGFTEGGNTGSLVNIIDKFNFSSNVTATDHGDLTETVIGPAGHSSLTQGFRSAGFNGTIRTTVIDKFDFASNTTAADHGDLVTAVNFPAGQSSTTQGFKSGGSTGTPVNIVERFDFASNVTASDHGDLSTTRFETTGQSSTTQGFTSGGTGPVNTIDKFDYSSNVTAADHGDLSVARNLVCGQQD